MVLLAAAFGIAGMEAPGRLGRALWPGSLGLPSGPAPLLQAWITPPGYTGLPPVFLRPDVPAVSVPAGSRLTANLTGSRGEPRLVLNGEAAPFQPLDPGSWQAERDLTAGGTLEVRRGFGTVAGWTLTVVPDQPPGVAWNGVPAVQGRGGPAIRLPWRVTDDHGVTGLSAELRLRDRPDAPPLSVPLPLPGQPRSAQGTAQPDLTAHPWAGLPVTIRLLARDGANQTGRSDDAAITLPEHRFRHPVAVALMAIRKALSLSPDPRAAAIAVAELAASPDAYDGDDGVFLNLSTIVSLLLHDRGPDALDEAGERMWQTALHLDENGASRTAQALAKARREVRQALDRARNQPGGQRDPAARSPEQAELQRRIEAMRGAMQRHLQALAEQARREGAMAPDPAGPILSGRDLDRLAQQAEDLARSGDMAGAERKLAELDAVLKQLQSARPMTRQAARDAARQRGNQQLNALEDLARRESGLSGRAQARGAAGGKPGAEAQADARAQRDLRRALGELAQRQGDLTGEVPAPLGEADQAMRDAAEALAAGQDAKAAAAAQRATQALRQGGQEMASRMTRQFGLQTGKDGKEQGEGEDGQAAESGDGDQSQPGRRDPLGRLTQDGNAGSARSQGALPGDLADPARSRAIQDELRRRDAERTRPRPELDYIERLLKPY